jgi:hypothetical protein
MGWATHEMLLAAIEQEQIETHQQWYLLLLLNKYVS